MNIYKIWVGKKPIPDIFKKWTNTWYLISDAKIVDIGNEYIEKVRHSRAVQWALAHDNYAVLNHYIRYHLLYHEGGIYMDLDVEVIKDSVIWYSEGLQIGMEMPNWANNHVMVCHNAGNTFFKHCMIAMDTMPYDQMDEVELNTGPRLVTRILQDGGFDPYCVEETTHTLYGYVHPERVFSPHRWNQTYHPSEITPDTLAVHHFYHSWKPE